MSKGQRDLAKEQSWREAIGRHGSSGLSVREFCRREGLKEASFFAWRRTIAERDGGATPAFVPAVVTNETPTTPSIVIESPPGCVLRLPPSTPAAWVAEFLVALGARPER